jgi:hypothetical protein
MSLPGSVSAHARQMSSTGHCARQIFAAAFRSAEFSEVHQGRWCSGTVAHRPLRSSGG